MKINKLFVKNFKGILEDTIEFSSPILACPGSNGVGKTSFLEAFRFAITGDTPEFPIAEGASEAVVRIWTDSDVIERRLIRTKTGCQCKNKLNDKSVTGTALDEYLTEKCGVPAANAKMITSSEILSKMDASEFGDFLLSYMSDSYRFSDIAEILNSDEPLTPERKRILSVTLPPDEIPLMFDDISASYDSFFAERKFLRREIDSKKAIIGDFDETKAPCPRRLELIEKDLEKITKEEGSYEASKKLMENYKTALETRTRQENKIKELRSSADAIKASRPNPAYRDGLEKELSAKTQFVIEINRNISTLEANRKLCAATLYNLESNICPVSEKLICTTDKTPIKKELQKAVFETDAEITKNREAVTKTEAEIKQIKEQIRIYEEAKRLYENKVILLKQISDMKKSLITLPEKPVITASADVSRKKEELKNEKKQAEEYARKLDEKKKLDSLTSKYKDYDYLVNAFSPKGFLYQKIIGKYLGLLSEEINRKAAEMDTGFEIRFIYDKGVKFECMPNGGSTFLPFKVLSSGEKAVVLFLVMDLLNSLSGLRISVMDDLDKLDSDNLKALLELVKKAEPDYDHCILAMVDHEDSLSAVTDAGIIMK